MMALVAVSARTTCAVAVAQVLFYMATKVFLHQYSPMMKFLSVSVDCVLWSVHPVHVAVVSGQIHHLLDVLASNVCGFRARNDTRGSHSLECGCM
jgi:hypothetical protein